MAVAVARVARMPRRKISEPLEKSDQGAHETGVFSPLQVPPNLVEEELQRILASPSFSQSQRLSRFLRFAVDQLQADKGDELKEYLVGITVFDRDEAYDPRTDPIVRVEAGRLRTKLREYYATEGRDDSVIIDLPKGSYIPSISLRQPLLDGHEKKILSIGRIAKFFSTPVAVAAVLLAAFLFFQNQQLRREVATNPPPRLSPEFRTIWEPFLAAGVPTHVVIGSPFFFAAPGNRLFLRAYDVADVQGLNTDPAFQRLRDRFGPLIGPPRYDYVLEGDALALQRLTEFLGQAGVEVTPMGSHKTTWDAIQNGNIILLGASRMNHLMRHFPRELDFEWESETDLRNRHPRPGEQEVYRGMSPEGFSFTNPDSLEHFHDYAMVGSFPGLRPNREILMIAAHGGPGVSEAVEYLTHRETMTSLLQRLKLPNEGRRQHFQVLLRVYVDRGNPVRTEYVTHHLTQYPSPGIP
jgi:hypothetical protein